MHRNREELTAQISRRVSVQPVRSAQKSNKVRPALNSDFCIDFETTEFWFCTVFETVRPALNSVRTVRTETEIEADSVCMFFEVKDRN